MSFPGAGIDVSAALDRQPIRDVGGAYAYSTPEGVNVVSYEPVLDRSRGGSRSGIVKYLPTRVPGGRWLLQDVNMIVTQSSAAQA